MDFETRSLPAQPDAEAPDGSEVRILARLDRGSMAHFQLAPGMVSIAIAHRTVDELWYVLEGRGEMWRRAGDSEAVVTMEPGTSLSIPAGTHFQFRSEGDEPLRAIGVTMPAWPGPDEAYRVAGRWPEPA